MAFKVIASVSFKTRLAAVYEYLKIEWSDKVANTFLAKVESTIESLTKTPTIGSTCEKFAEVRKLAITKHNKIYYKIKGKTVYIIAMIDTRQSPKRNKYE